MNCLQSQLLCIFYLEKNKILELFLYSIFFVHYILLDFINPTNLNALKLLILANTHQNYNSLIHRRPFFFIIFLHLLKKVRRMYLACMFILDIYNYLISKISIKIMFFFSSSSFTLFVYN